MKPFLVGILGSSLFLGAEDANVREVVYSYSNTRRPRGATNECSFSAYAPPLGTSGHIVSLCQEQSSVMYSVGAREQRRGHKNAETTLVFRFERSTVIGIAVTDDVEIRRNEVQARFTDRLSVLLAHKT